MQRILYFLCISLFITSCAQDKPDGFVINGNLDNAKNNELVKLLKSEGQKTITVDSTRITENTFQFTGKIENPDMHFIAIDGVQGGVPFILENETLDIAIYTDSIFASSITGGKENILFRDYQENIKALRNKNMRLESEFRIAQQNQDSIKIASLRNEYEANMKENEASDIDFMTKNKDAVISGLILEGAIMSNKFEFAEIKKLYTNFDDKIKNSRAGKVISDYILANEKTAVGSIIPNFSAPTPDGKMLALNDIKGKVTIVDFWAAWCAPCRRENPNVVKVYEKYHDKGLEIIGVSLDGTPQQKDPRQAWLDAIERDNLTWHQVSNLQYFNDPIARQFNINAIPATFIIDAEGKILAKNLRGPALESKIAELLD